MPAVESLCRSVGAAAAASGEPPTAPPRVLVLKHALRDEYDDLTDIARVHRIKARGCAAAVGLLALLALTACPSVVHVLQSAPSFACFVGGALVEVWSGGSRSRLEAALARWGSPPPPKALDAAPTSR